MAIPDFSTVKLSLQQQSVPATPSQNATVQTAEGINIKNYYTYEDKAQSGYTHSFPGLSPFIRGPYPTMYFTRPWTIRQYAGFSTAEASNAFYRRNLAAGQKGLSVAFDLPTHRGYDSDNERVKSDVGMAGVAIDSIYDMQILFDQIPLDKMSVSMTMNGAVLPIMALYIVAAEQQGVPPEKLTGTIQNDILKEFMVRNTYIFPPQFSMRIISDIFAYISQNMPSYNMVSISGYHMQEAGASLDLELAYTLADGLEYIRTGLKSGLDIDDFAPRLSFFWAIGMNFFMEIAKMRAARLLWSQLVSRFSPRDPRSLCLRAHCQTSGWSLAAQDVYNNIPRTMIEAIAAITGQTQSLHTNAFDEALALPTEFSAQIARDTQLYLQNNSNMTQFIDPWGGSYCIETLTQQIAAQAQKNIDEVEKLGGMTKAIERQIPQQRIEEAAILRQAHIDSNQHKIIGVNCHTPITDNTPTDILKINNEKVLQTQIEKLKKLRKERNADDIEYVLNKIYKASKENKGNLLELCIEAARKKATVGEMTQAMQKAQKRHVNYAQTRSGIYKLGLKDDDNVVQDINWLQEVFYTKHKRKPRILVAKIGQDGHDRGQKAVSSALIDLGFNVVMGQLFLTPQEVVENALKNDVDIIGISSLAGGHIAHAKHVQNCLKELNVTNIYVVIGGIIPPQDFQTLYDMDITAIMPSGTPITRSAQLMLRKILHHNIT